MTSPSAGDPGEFMRIEDKLCTTEALLRRGFAERDALKVLGQNLVRVFRAAWQD